MGATSADEVISASRVDSILSTIAITSILKASAEKGSSESQYQLGLALINKMGSYRGTPDYWDTFEEGKAWVLKSAEQGNKQALYVMAQLNTEDTSQRIQILKNSAQQNYPPALHEVGLMYFYGHFNDISHEKNYSKALEYFELATQAGSLRSQMRLASLYFNGWGVSRDTNKAHDLILSAAERGLSRAYHRLALDWYDTGALTPNAKRFRLYQRMYEMMQKKYGVFCGEDRQNRDLRCQRDLDFDNPLYEIFFQFAPFIL